MTLTECALLTPLHFRYQRFVYNVMLYSHI
jgi:hypothetical protein